MSHAITKQQRLDQVKRLLLMHPEGIHINDIQQAVDPDMDWSSIWRFVVRDLNAQKLEKGVYTLDPSQSDVELAIAILKRARGARTQQGMELTEEDVHSMYKDYLNGATHRQIASEWGVHRSRVSALFQKYGLPSPKSSTPKEHE